VPPGVTQVTIDAKGAQGGGTAGGKGAGGNGADVQATFPVTRGETLNVVVGGTGTDKSDSGGGGGGSFVYRNPTPTGLLIAAANGGAGVRTLWAATDACPTRRPTAGLMVTHLVRAAPQTGVATAAAAVPGRTKQGPVAAAWLPTAEAGPLGAGAQVPRWADGR
jgi:hypothetical protein